jgi:hypothetical protein
MDEAPEAVHPLNMSAALAMASAHAYGLCFMKTFLFKFEWTVIRKSAQAAPLPPKPTHKLSEPSGSRALKSH